MKQRWGDLVYQGFALPTVLIASVVLLIVLATSVQLTVSTSTALQEQLYNRSATLAAEAGVEHAKSCLQANDFTPQWSDASPLRPGSSCAGYTGGNCPTTCLVASGTSLRTSYSVGSANATIAGAVSYTSVGKAERLRTSTGTVWRSYDAKVGNSSWFADGAKVSTGGGWKGYGHFGTVVTPNGELYGFGGNNARQFTDSSIPTIMPTPTKIALPPGVSKVKQSYTSGQGALVLCIVSTEEDAYCRGEAWYGNSSFGGPNVGWNKVGLPAGYKVKKMVLDGYGQGDGGCVIASNGVSSDAYCFGKGDYGMLGGNTMSYTSLASPVRFQLPAGQQAADVWMHDINTCVKNTQGELYCAGYDNGGQITGNGGDNPIPVRYNIPGGRKVKDVAMQYHGDGSTVHVLTTDGMMWATGWYSNGTVVAGNNSGNTRSNNANQAMVFNDNNRPIGGPILNFGSNRCVDNYFGSSADNNGLVVHDCNSTGAQNWLYDAETLRVINATTGKCMSRLNNGTANGETVVQRTCDLSGEQRWRFSGNDIIDVTTGKCLDVKNRATANASPLGIWGCEAGGQQDFNPTGLDNGWQGMIAGNNFICGVRNGAGSGVWCSGQGGSGQLGNYLDANNADGGPCASTGSGTPLYYEMKLPPGEEIDPSKLSSEWSQQFQSIMVITKSGKVFGSGRNEFGKLGNGGLGDAGNDFRQCSVVQYQMPAGVTAVDMSTRDEFTTYVVGSNGRVYAAGRNNNGQIGDGTTVNRYTAVPVVIPRVGFYF